MPDQPSGPAATDTDDASSCGGCSDASSIAISTPGGDCVLPLYAADASEPTERVYMCALYRELGDELPSVGESPCKATDELLQLRSHGAARVLSNAVYVLAMELERQAWLASSHTCRSAHQAEAAAVADCSASYCSPHECEPCGGPDFAAQPASCSAASPASSIGKPGGTPPAAPVTPACERSRPPRASPCPAPLFVGSSFLAQASLSCLASDVSLAAGARSSTTYPGPGLRHGRSEAGWMRHSDYGAGSEVDAPSFLRSTAASRAKESAQ
jgi:hypothetical protein